MSFAWLGIVAVAGTLLFVLVRWGDLAQNAAVERLADYVARSNSP